jgi:hypothetical protein
MPPFTDGNFEEIKWYPLRHETICSILTTERRWIRTEKRRKPELRKHGRTGWGVPRFPLCRCRPRADLDGRAHRDLSGRQIYCCQCYWRRRNTGTKYRDRNTGTDGTYPIFQGKNAPPHMWSSRTEKSYSNGELIPQSVSREMTVRFLTRHGKRLLVRSRGLRNLPQSVIFLNFAINLQSRRYPQPSR